MSVTYAGTIYETISLAALGFAHAALPDPSVLDASEMAGAVAHDLEAYCYRQAAQAGQTETPDGVTPDYWRALCRGAIAAVVVAYREGRRAYGRDVEVVW